MREENTDIQANQWLEIFSIFIHDLESPLVSMKYLLKMLREGKLDPDKPLHQRLVASSGIALERAESIIYDILAVAKAGKVGLPVELINFVPDTLIRETIDLATAAAGENNINFTFTNDSGNTEDKLNKVIVTEFFGKLTGFWVDRLDWIHHFKWEDIIDTGTVFTGIDQRYVIGIVKPTEDRMVQFLDYERY